MFLLFSKSLLLFFLFFLLFDLLLYLFFLFLYFLTLLPFPDIILLNIIFIFFDPCWRLGIASITSIATLHPRWSACSIIGTILRLLNPRRFVDRNIYRSCCTLSQIMILCRRTRLRFCVICFFLFFNPRRLISARICIIFSPRSQVIIASNYWSLTTYRRRIIILSPRSFITCWRPNNSLLTSSITFYPRRLSNTANVLRFRGIICFNNTAFSHSSLSNIGRAWRFNISIVVLNPRRLIASLRWLDSSLIWVIIFNPRWLVCCCCTIFSPSRLRIDIFWVITCVRSLTIAIVHPSRLSWTFLRRFGIIISPRSLIVWSTLCVFLDPRGWGSRVIGVFEILIDGTAGLVRYWSTSKLVRGD